jgi:single-strand DNA-binding protein
LANLNKVMLIGNAGKDSELRYLANGTPQAKFSLAVNHNTRNKDTKEWESQTEWFNVVIWGDTAERISEHIRKGKSLYIDGRLQTRKWDDDKGQTHYMTEVIANTVQLLDKREGAEARPETAQYADELPFE